MGKISAEHIDIMALDSIQQKHESEIELLNEIDDLITQYNKDQSTQDNLEKKLVEYINHVKEHFETEESLMQEHGDPLFDQHKMAHDMFLADLNYASMIWNKSSDIEKLLSVVKKAPEWLISHVNSIDRPTAEFLAIKMGHKVEQQEEEMTLEEIAFELELAGVGRDKMNKLLASIKRDGFNPTAIDRKLETMGFAPVFTIYD